MNGTDWGGAGNGGISRFSPSKIKKIVGDRRLKRWFISGKNYIETKEWAKKVLYQTINADHVLHSVNSCFWVSVHI